MRLGDANLSEEFLQWHPNPPFIYPRFRIYVTSIGKIESSLEEVKVSEHYRGLEISSKNLLKK